MTDYQELARELLENMPKFSKAPMQKNADRFVRGEMPALVFLSYHSAASPGEISDELNISTARTAKLLATLASKGFITRVPDDKDKRKICVKLTDAGSFHIEAHKTHVLESASEMLKDLGEKDAVEYVRITKRIVENAASKPNAPKKSTTERNQLHDKNF